MGYFRADSHLRPSTKVRISLLHSLCCGSSGVLKKTFAQNCFRSAFRGTPEAFKWDNLAIQATKVAIERGYFETAYKSTLNQFVILLPLEHSEAWDDQKLGVTLLLRLLSTVAVEDEGLSDYEIVKRLEFSKRLAVAFLEHAQVVKQFHRYPHRNTPLGRKTSLEERVWLASDLVPRWAKSQNKEGAKNLIQLPVIPLKRLIRKQG
jgi:uncharacterized protein (DUF924 family)